MINLEEICLKKLRVQAILFIAVKSSHPTVKIILYSPDLQPTAPIAAYESLFAILAEQ
jgi:hypothetical protein